MRIRDHAAKIVGQNWRIRARLPRLAKLAALNGQLKKN